MKVRVDYSFIFEPSDTWSTMSEFEDWLASSLKQAGLGAERVRSVLLEDESPTTEFIIHQLPEAEMPNGNS